MNPLAAALLAAQGWDPSKWSGQADKAGSGSTMDIEATTNQPDLSAILGNPAVLQALAAQMSAGSHPSQASASSNTTSADPAPPSSFNLTPGQTTRFGRVSRPPVAAPVQNQLAMLQQILGTSNQTQSTNPPAASGTRSSHHGVPSGSRQSSSQQRADPMPQRTNGVKRPHSALRDNSIPPQAPNPPPRTARELSPLTRPVPPSIGGRPKRDDEGSKEERLERRRIRNSQSAADYRKKKELYIQSLEDRLREKELEVKAKSEECEKWRQKFVDMEKQHVVLAALWTAAGYSLPDAAGSMPSLDRVPLPTSSMGPPQSASSGGLRTMPESRNAPSMSPASMNPPIRSPIPLPSPNNVHAFPSPAHSTPLATASSTLAMPMQPVNHPTMSPLTTLPGSSPVETPDQQAFDTGVDWSAFDDFFNWDIMPDSDADDQQDADFVPASSPKRDSDDSDEEGDSNDEDKPKKNKKRKTQGKAKSKSKSKRRQDDDDFVDPEEDEEDLFMPITDVDVPPGQMQLVEKATQDVMSTFGVDSQMQLTGVMQKIVDAGDGLTGEQLEKMKSVLRWYKHTSLTRP